MESPQLPATAEIPQTYLQKSPYQWKNDQQNIWNDEYNLYKFAGKLAEELKHSMTQSHD